MADWDSWGATPSNPPASKVSAGWDEPTSTSPPRAAPSNGHAEPSHLNYPAPYANQNSSPDDSRPPAVKMEPTFNATNGPPSHSQSPHNPIQPASTINGWNAAPPPSNSHQPNPSPHQGYNGPLRSSVVSASPNAIPANWGGVPPPTFSAGPRSTASHPSSGQHQTVPEPVQSNSTSSGWKPSAPSFVPRTQAGHPGQNEPAISLNTFLKGAQGSKWAAENIPPPSFGAPAALDNTTTTPNNTTTTSTNASGVVSGSNFAPPQATNEQSGNPASTPTTTINGWTVTSSSTSNAIQDPLAPTSSSMPRGQGDSSPPSVSHISVESNGQGWNNQAPSSITSNTSNPAFIDPASVGWKVGTFTVAVAPASVAPEIHGGETSKPAFHPPCQAAHTAPASNAVSISNPGPQPPHERKVTHDSGWGDENVPKRGQFLSHDGVAPQGVPSTQPASVNGWIVAQPASATITSSSREDAVAPLIQSMSNIQLAGGNSSDHVDSNKPSGNGYATHVPPVTNANSGSVPIGWQTSQPSPAAATSTPATTNNGWTPRPFAGVPDQPSATSATFVPALEQTHSSNHGTGWNVPSTQATPPTVSQALHPAPATSSGGIGWGDVPSQSSAVPVSQAPAPPVHQFINGPFSEQKPINTAPPSGGIGWGDAAPAASWGAPRPDTFNSGGGGNPYSGGYGAPAERRFPGPAGSWASGPNEIPLRHNKWASRTGGGRPGEDVHRPVVPQAIPGSGW